VELAQRWREAALGDMWMIWREQEDFHQVKRIKGGGTHIHITYIILRKEREGNCVLVRKRGTLKINISVFLHSFSCDNKYF
jgi:hypothetical protein